MRYLITIGFCLLLFSSCFQKKKTDIVEWKTERFKSYTNDTIQKRLKEIVRTDSIKNSEFCYLIYKSYDSLDRIVNELKYYQCQNNSKNEYLTQNVYNEEGKVILYELFNMEGLEIERYKYDYNDKGLLTLKEGFGSGEIGITIKYYYSEAGKLIDKKAFRFGKEIENYNLK